MPFNRKNFRIFAFFSRDFQYRLISTYTFSESSRHSEHNDMRQGYVLINLQLHDVADETLAA